MKAQRIARFIEVTGAANIGWTEAGLIEGNDPYNGADTVYWPPGRSSRPARVDRFYKPVWIKEAEDMYAQLELTRANIAREQREQRKIDKLIADAHPRSDTSGLTDLFSLEWDSTAAEDAESAKRAAADVERLARLEKERQVTNVQREPANKEGAAGASIGRNWQAEDARQAEAERQALEAFHAAAKWFQEDERQADAD